jgi:CHAT domain-containing protein
VTKDYNPIPDLEVLFKHDQLVVWEFLYFPNWYQYKEQFKILVWEKESIRVFTSNPFDNTRLETLNRDFHENFQQGTQKSLQVALDKLKQLQDELTQLLPEELLRTLENKKKLILIPQGILHLFPWEVVEKVGLKIPVIRSYSLGLLRSCMKRERPTRNFLLIANPNYNIKGLNLPGADLEAHSIKKLLKRLKLDFKLLDHEEAVEDAFIDLINQEFGVIHFAGHGVYELTKNDPWTSGLLFYRSDGYDLRTVTELVEQGFKGTPLCVLSACETGRAEVSKGGDELIGLIRGLTLAGVTSIIATHWLLDDSVAPHFMQKFYESFFSGKDVSESLFLARKQVHETFEHPINWSVYTLYGNPFKRMAN